MTMNTGITMTTNMERAVAAMTMNLTIIMTTNMEKAVAAMTMNITIIMTTNMKKAVAAMTMNITIIMTTNMKKAVAVMAMNITIIMLMKCSRVGDRKPHTSIPKNSYPPFCLRWVISLLARFCVQKGLFPHLTVNGSTSTLFPVSRKSVTVQQIIPVGCASLVPIWIRTALRSCLECKS